MVRPVLDKGAVAVMREWLMNEKNFKHPYPNDKERQQLAEQAGIQPRQVMNWFTNARKRLWQPLLKERGEDVAKYLSNGKNNLRVGTATRRVNTPKRLKHTEQQTVVKPIVDRNGLRRGQWSKEEHAYAQAIIRAFEVGVLVMKEKTTLRSYLAQKLNCDPMRISKKFVGKSSIGKHFMTQTTKALCMTNDLHEIKSATEHLHKTEALFLASIDRTSEDGGCHGKSSSSSSRTGKIRFRGDDENEDGETCLKQHSSGDFSSFSKINPHKTDMDITSSTASTASLSEESLDLNSLHDSTEEFHSNQVDDVMASFHDVDDMIDFDMFGVNDPSDKDSLSDEFIMDAFLVEDNFQPIMKKEMSLATTNNPTNAPSSVLGGNDYYSQVIPPSMWEIYRHTLVLELKGTLLHLNSGKDAPSIVKRPHLDYFLNEMNYWFDIVIFTSLERNIAERIINRIDPRNMIKSKYYAEDCLNLGGVLFKDMRLVNHDLSSLILVDNVHATSALQMDNHIGIPMFTGNDKEDNVLLELMETLRAAVSVNDVRLFVDLSQQTQWSSQAMELPLFS